MKRIQKFLAGALALSFLVQPSLGLADTGVENDTSPVAAGQESQLEVEPLAGEDSTPSEELMISPISRDFIDSSIAGQKASPLLVDYKHKDIKTRSRARHVPSRYDLRDEGRVSPVKDQGKNGSCWTFASLASLESVMSRYGSFDFSEKHMRNKHGFDWGPNDGGNRDIATAYMASWLGPVREIDDPYDPVISVSPDVERAMDLDEVLYLPDVASFNDTGDIKLAIMDHGAVYTVINSSKYYENENTYSYYNPGGGQSDHAVAIVGWDDSFPKESFNSKPKEDGAWIMKNSWGPSYMDRGYYYVSYEDVYAGTSNALFMGKKKDNNGKIYQYDPLGATRSVGYDKEGYMANIFKASGEETLHEVGLYSMSMYTDYEIYLVRDVKRTSQLSDERIKVAEGNFTYPGYHTVDIDQAELKEGEQFAIVVYLNSEKAGYKYPLAVESIINGYSSEARAGKGESYVSSNGKTWSDLTDQLSNANACIKAITTTGEVIDEENDKPIDPDEDIELPNEVRNLSFKEGDAGYLRIHQLGQLTPVIEPSDLEDVEIKYTSSDPRIATVSQDGVIKPEMVGNVRISIETEVSRGIIRSAFNLKIIPKDIRYDWLDPIPVVGENDLDFIEDEDFEPADPPKPDIDESVIRSFYIKIPSLTMSEGEEYNLDEKVIQYPDTADRKFSYESTNTDIVEVTSEGILKAKAPGKATIKVRAPELSHQEVKIVVLPKYQEHPLELTKFDITDRDAGYFTINFEASENSKGYSGPARVMTKVGNDQDGYKERESTIYFTKGKAEITYSGGDFGTWRTNFETRIKIRDLEDSAKYEFSKSSKSPVYMKSYPEAHKSELSNYSFGDFEVSERKAGIFTIDFTAEKDGQPYTGDAIVTTESGNKFNSSTIHFTDGRAQIKYNGAQFYVWNDDFETTLKIDHMEETQKYTRENK